MSRLLAIFPLAGMLVFGGVAASMWGVVATEWTRGGWMWVSTFSGLGIIATLIAGGLGVLTLGIAAYGVEE